MRSRYLEQMVIPEHKSGTPCWPRLASLVGFAVLFASGIVLAFSWEVDFPEPVLTLTWIVATVAALVVVGAVWTDSRRAGLGFFRSLGRSLRGLGRFILGFFSSPEALGRFDRSWRDPLVSAMASDLRLIAAKGVEGAVCVCPLYGRWSWRSITSAAATYPQSSHLAAEVGLLSALASRAHSGRAGLLINVLTTSAA